MSTKSLLTGVIYCFFVMLFIECKSHSSFVSTLGNDLEPTLVISNGLKEHQFEGNSDKKLVVIEVVGNVSIIPQWSFAIVPTLKVVKLSPNVKILDENAFFSCKKLSKINLNNVESIGENCFKFSALEDVNLSKAKRIKDFAFSHCPYLKNIKFSESLKTIGEFAFSGDSSLVTCYIPSGEIGASAFMGCSHLEQITLGKVVSIGNAAFLDCNSLSSLVIPSSVKSIGNEAFAGCTNLREVIVNNRDTKIAEDAFAKNVIITYKK